MASNIYMLQKKHYIYLHNFIHKYFLANFSSPATELSETIFTMTIIIIIAAGGGLLVIVVTVIIASIICCTVLKKRRKNSKNLFVNNSM